jgi:hypothetical protein
MNAVGKEDAVLALVKRNSPESHLASSDQGFNSGGIHLNQITAEVTATQCMNNITLC